jgi:hypothetical protein
MVPGKIFVATFSRSSTMGYLATAVDVERSFSRGRILINHLRNCLHAASIHALMCFGDWCRLGLVPDAELARALKSTTEKGKAKV